MHKKFIDIYTVCNLQGLKCHLQTGWHLNLHRDKEFNKVTYLIKMVSEC